jgi:threonine/homoserine/homoserine lactone efflux protein
MNLPSLSELTPHGTALMALTIGAVLLTPGPTNTLLFLAGSRDGLRRSLRLIGAEWIGYIIAIGIWCAFLALAAAVAPKAPMAARACAAVYLPGSTALRKAAFSCGSVTAIRRFSKSADHS